MKKNGISQATRETETSRFGFLRNLTTFSSFRNPVYRVYYGCMLCQTASMNMQMMARSLLTYRLTNSPSILAIIAAAHAMPMVVLSLFGGVIADRFQKRRVLLWGQLGSALIALCISIFLAQNYLIAARPGSWRILLVTSTLQGVIMGLMIPSRHALVAEIVGPEQLMNAVALHSFGVNTFRIAGPALAGILIDFWGFEAAYYAITALYIMAALFISAMPPPNSTTQIERKVLKNLKMGLQYVRKQTTILFLLALVLVVVILSMPIISLMPIFTDDILKVGAAGMGALMGVLGLGAITGSIVLASLPNKRRGILLLISCLIIGVALSGFCFSESWYTSLVLIAIMGVGRAGRTTLSTTLLQSLSEDTYRGRVMSIYTMEFGMRSIGILVAGLLAERIGVQWSVGGLAMLLVIIVLCALVFAPRIRKLN